MSPRIVRASEVTPVPWKNGGGWTRELLTWPSPAAWRLRISVADIEADGPFSPFPGVERWFTVLEGEGVVLRFGEAETTVRPGDTPLCFDGGAAPQCRLLAGPTRDLNLMVRGGHGGMEPVCHGVEWQPRAGQGGLFTAVAGSWQRADGRAGLVPAYTLLWFADSPTAALTFAADSAPPIPAGWWLSFTPRPGHASNGVGAA